MRLPVAHHRLVQLQKALIQSMYKGWSRNVCGKYLDRVLAAYIWLASYCANCYIHNCTSCSVDCSDTGDHVPLQSTGHLCVGH